MKRSLRKDVIEELLRDPQHMVSLSHLVGALAGECDRRAEIRRVMEHLVRQELVAVVRRRERPDLTPGRSRQEILYMPKAGLKACLAKSRRDGTGWDRMWCVIRALSKGRAAWTRREVMALAQVTDANAVQFTKLLRRAGWIRDLGKGQWALVKDPGPKRPVGGRS